MAVQMSGEVTNLTSKVKDFQDDFEEMEGAKGESMQTKSVKTEQCKEGASTFAATEGATQSKMVCKSEDTVKDLEDEILELPSKEVSERSSHTNLNNLLSYSPKPQPPITEKQIKVIQKGKDQSSLMAEQVNKMKRGMEKLQEITQKFNCMEKYKEDVDFLVKNLANSLVDGSKQATNDKKEKTDNKND